MPSRIYSAFGIWRERFQEKSRRLRCVFSTSNNNYYSVSSQYNIISVYFMYVIDIRTSKSIRFLLNCWVCVRRRKCVCVSIYVHNIIIVIYIDLNFSLIDPMQRYSPKSSFVLRRYNNYYYCEKFERCKMLRSTSIRRVYILYNILLYYTKTNEFIIFTFINCTPSSNTQSRRNIN